MSLQALALGSRMTIEVVLAHELGERFLELPKAMERTIARKALREGVQPMLPAIKAGIHSRTGLLARSTRIRLGRKDRPDRYAVIISAWTTAGTFAKARVRSGRPAAAASVLARHAKSNAYSVFYGLFVERGHGGPRAAPPHPFAGPGFDMTADRVGEDVETKIGDAVEKEI